MFYFLLTLGFGIAIGCSIAASNTTTLDDLTRVEYIRKMWGYNMGWRYDRSPGNYDFSLKLYKEPETKRSWSLF